MISKAIVLTPQSNVAGVCASQTPSGAANLTINGTFASGGAVSLNHGHLIKFTSLSNISNRTFTITGTDFRGLAMTETVTGPNATSVFGTKYFKTISQIAISGAAAGALTVGTDGTSASQWVPADRHVTPFNIGLFAVPSATLTYTVQHTPDDLQVYTDISGVSVFNHATMAAQTSGQDGNYAYPVAAFRIIITAWTSGTLAFTSIQAGK